MDDKDKVLVREAKTGNKAAFDNLVRIYRDKMFAHIYRMTGDRETALDLVQDTFLTVYKELRNFREEASFSGWIYKIASNKALNHIKRNKIVKFVTFSSDNPTHEPAYEMTDNIKNDEIKKQMSRAVADLPPKQKLVFNMRFYDKLPFKEIASITGKAESTVKTNYQKAVEKLRKKLKSFR